MTSYFQSDVVTYNTGATGTTIGYNNPYATASGLGTAYTPEYQQQLYDNQVYGNSLFNYDQSQSSALEQKVKNFVSYIEDGEEDLAVQAYNDLLQELNKNNNFQNQVRADGDDAQLRASANAAIAKYLETRDDKTIDIEDWLEDNTSDVHEQHKQYCSTWDDSIVDENTTEDLIKMMTGREVRKEGGDRYHFGDGCRNVFASFHNWLWGRDHF
jgi:hypothetical protein